MVAGTETKKTAFVREPATFMTFSKEESVTPAHEATSMSWMICSTVSANAGVLYFLERITN
jgi:hypothetical protein